LTALGERSTAHSVTSVIARTRSHLDTLAQLGLRDRVRYVRVRAMDRVNAAIGDRLTLAFKRLVCDFCLRLHVRLPVFVRSFYLLAIYRDALMEYSPQMFDGRTVYFKSSTRWKSHQESWSRVVAGGFEVQEVPGDHMTIIRRENAGRWAERLAQCVAEAQRRRP
jgi:hypothetical protein